MTPSALRNTFKNFKEPVGLCQCALTVAQVPSVLVGDVLSEDFVSSDFGAATKEHSGVYHSIRDPSRDYLRDTRHRAPVLGYLVVQPSCSGWRHIRYHVMMPVGTRILSGNRLIPYRGYPARSRMLNQSSAGLILIDKITIYSNIFKYV